MNNALTKLISSTSAIAGAVLLATGCATTQAPSANAPIKEDKNAQAKSQAYLSGTVWAMAADAHSSCVVPASVEKPPAPSQGQSKDWKDLVMHANGCVADKNWATLDKLAAIIARNDIDSPWGAYFYSVAAEANGDFSRAIWMAELAEKKAGGRAGLFFYQRGHVMLTMKETVKAMDDFEKALSLEANLNDAHLFLAQIYHRDQQLDKATKHYAAVLLTEPKNYAALTGLAEVKIRNGSGAEAADLYQKAVAVQPKEFQPWVRLAYVYETLQKSPEQALAAYRALKTGLDSGSIKGRTEFDLTAKIKTIESSLLPRVPAQAKNETAVSAPESKRSKK